MFCCRILCFVLLLLATAAAACACFFPLLERETTVKGSAGAATIDVKHSLRVYAWYTQQKTNKEFYEQVYTRDIACSRTKMMFMATAVSTAVAIVFGVIGTLIASGALSYRNKRRCPCCSTFLFSLLAFAFLVVPIALTTTLYLNSSCGAGKGAAESSSTSNVATCAKSSNCSYDVVSRFLLYESTSSGDAAAQFPSLKGLGFPIGGVGFCCLCGAAGGMLLSLLLSICA